MALRFGKWILPVSLALAFFMSAFCVLPAAGEEAAEEEKGLTFSRLQEELDEFLALMGQGDVEGAFEALNRYVQDLKAFCEAEGSLPEEEMRIAHILYVTSKHLVVLARVYGKLPEAARKGVGNALVRSVKGHGHFYAALDGASSSEEPEGEAAEGTFEERERDKGNSGGRGNPGSRSGKGRKR
ncbi:hypothetical protein [Candidatus Solincola tengchongensis]|uniref:hypothetical protein n=1 Tax=Candidatus Solincola tengchongensis TaxID=2900693 RepID=UPI00257E235C|nr:hypothetical protein [Candidatus Solincola tengchongensis]